MRYGAEVENKRSDCLGHAWPGRGGGGVSRFHQSSRASTAQWQTGFIPRNAQFAVEAYRAENGVLPPTLLASDADLEDAWENPLIYQVMGERFLVISLGADGAPGGGGDNMLLTSDTPYPDPSTSFWQRGPAVQMVILACLGAGLFAGAAAFRRDASVDGAASF
jgi:hypothetical protein